MEMDRRERRGMTIHRGRRGGRRPEEDRPLTFLETVTAFTAFQICLCALALGAAFTLQFLDPAGYEELGQYFLAAMGRGEGEAAARVGNFGEPLDPEEILRELERAVLGEAAGAMGGENPWIPPNLCDGGILVSAPARDPVRGELTSPFGLRTHPITGEQDFHTGVDIAAPAGADIWAAYPGTVAEVGESETYGNFITLDHGGGLSTTYCHCSAVLAREGQRLPAGARIAEVGSTGVSTGPHLHFEVRVDGDYGDPLFLFCP